MKIVTVIGARPQFIKAAAFSRVAAKEDVVEEVIVHTGQHFDANMSEVFFEELQIPKPKYNLGIAGGSHAEMTGNMMIELERVLKKEEPDAVLVYGDTNSTMAAALAAVKIHIPVIHVEAGIRMGTLDNPEEVNRVVTDHVSTLLFTPTTDECVRLKEENIVNNVYAVGNIMYDSYLYAVSKQDKIIMNAVFKDFNDEQVTVPDKYYLMTCHRQENTYSDEPLKEILNAMNTLDYPTIYPVHPRNQERANRLCRKNGFSNIILIKPVGYLESVFLINNCIKVVTDSGGLQCEAFYAGKQCVTVLEHVVWPQTMVDNRNQLAHAEYKDILRKLSAEQCVDDSYRPFGDGHAAEKILCILLKSKEIGKNNGK